jgi:cysteine desulfurase / selenocysteine lyase
LGCRRLFPDLEVRAYLNHAGISPLSSLAAQAVAEAAAGLARGGAMQLQANLDTREQCRQRLAQLLGCQASDLAFTLSTSHGVNCIANSIDWRTGQRIVLLRGEFPTNVVAWLQAAQREGLTVDWLEADDFDSEIGLLKLEEALKSSPRLLCLSAVQFQTGLRLPVKQITALCHRYGTEVFCDVIQAAGCSPVDLLDWEVDYAAGGSHKWLMAAEGLGYVYVAQRHARSLKPNPTGWLSLEEGLRFLFEADQLSYQRPLVAAPGVFEMGTLNNFGVHALNASLVPLLELGVEAIHAHVNGYLDRLEPGLISLGFVSRRSSDRTRRSGSLSLQPAPLAKVSGCDLAHHWAAELALRGIQVASPDGLVRFAPQWPNSTDEIGFVLESVKEILA